VTARFAFLASLLALAAAACDAPPVAIATAAIAETPPSSPQMPGPVRAMVDQLKQLADEGDYRGLAKLADRQPGFRSNDGGMATRDYWRLKVSAGDDPTRQLARLLAEPPAVVDGADGRRYVWPALSTLRPADVTPVIAERIDDLLGAGQGAAFRAGWAWSGYSLAIREDGVWLWFINGNG
jgi:hypothetical protein